ncbi:MAG: hypothetical protein JJ957_20745, partial [Pseudomonadales bacterium]|nr:hypothetical protein [Pseudomonadales bacterium]
DGAATGLTTLSVAGTSDLGANVTTSGTQSYTGAVTVSTDVTLDSTGGALVLFSSTVDSTMTTANTLTIDGDAQFDGAVGVGVGTELGSVSVSGATALNNAVQTTGAQTYTGLATLGGDVDLEAGTSVQFVAGVSGSADALTISSGNLDLDGSVTGLTTLSVAGTSNLGA